MQRGDVVELRLPKGVVASNEGSDSGSSSNPMHSCLERWSWFPLRQRWRERPPYDPLLRFPANERKSWLSRFLPLASADSARVSRLFMVTQCGPSMTHWDWSLVSTKGVALNEGLQVFGRTLKTVHTLPRIEFTRAPISSSTYCVRRLSSTPRACDCTETKSPLLTPRLRRCESRRSATGAMNFRAVAGERPSLAANANFSHMSVNQRVQILDQTTGPGVFVLQRIAGSVNTSVRT